MTAPHLSPAPAPMLGARRPGWTTFAMLSVALLALPMVAGCSKEASSQKQEPTATAAASPNDPTVARVNGVEIRESDLAMAAQDIGQNLQNAPPETQREQLIAYVTDIILVSQAADAKKLTEDQHKQIVALKAPTKDGRRQVLEMLVKTAASFSTCEPWVIQLP